MIDFKYNYIFIDEDLQSNNIEWRTRDHFTATDARGKPGMPA